MNSEDAGQAREPEVDLLGAAATLSKVGEPRLINVKSRREKSGDSFSTDAPQLIFR